MPATRQKQDSLRLSEKMIVTAKILFFKYKQEMTGEIIFPHFLHND
jgi:hypothetical protein